MQRTADRYFAWLPAISYRQASSLHSLWINNATGDWDRGIGSGARTPAQKTVPSDVELHTQLEYS